MKTAEKTDQVKDVIEVELKWFSVLAEHRGKRKETLNISAGTTGAELIEKLSGEFPVLDKYQQYIRIAVNHEYSDPQTELRDGDKIAFITPVSGG